MDSSLRANLRYGRKSATDEEIYGALKDAYMYDFVMRLPDKLDTIVGEAGIKLSDGQRQLLTIARTMISQPSMLILDEATSSVDTLTEQKIQKRLSCYDEESYQLCDRPSSVNDSKCGSDSRAGSWTNRRDRQSSRTIEKDGFYKKLYEAQFSQS